MDIFTRHASVLAVAKIRRAMIAAELKKVMDCLTHEIRKRKGQFLYSGIDTLRPGKFYFLGFNPRTDDANVVLCDERLDRTDWSAYSKQCWTHGDCDRKCPRIGEDQHQKNVQRIMCELGLKPEETFATNLIFVESRGIKEIKADPCFETFLGACWRVHKKMLAEVEPDYIVCLGNNKEKRKSAFSSVQERAVRTENYLEEFTSKDLRYRKRFDGTFELDDGRILKAKVIGVKHPSYPMSPRGLRAFIGC
jgi:hypothetical protein